MTINARFKTLGIGVAMLTAVIPFAAVHAGDTQTNYSNSPIAADYVQNCQSNSCAMGDAAAWSALEENKNAVAVAVAMGTAKQVPDYQIKAILLDAFDKLDVDNVKFFFEQNDIENTGLTFHVRGGTNGPYALNRKVFDAAKEMAAYAKDDPPF
jgi:hypothetical protein